MTNTIFVSTHDPDHGYAFSTDAPVVAIKYGESGYYPIYTRATADSLNGDAVTPDIMLSAIVGSMFGWDVPGAKDARDFFLGRNET